MRPVDESLWSARLAVAFLTMLLVSGIGNTFPVFFPPLLEEFGGSRAATASTVTLIWLGAATLAPVAGSLVVRWSPRIVVLLGLGAAAAGLGLGATAPSLGVFTLYLTARGFSAAYASVLLVVGGILSTAGRALAGLLADRLGASTAGIVSYTVSIFGMLCLLAMELHPLALFVYGYVLLVFLPLGSRATIIAVLVTRIASPARYGVIFGALSVANSLGAAAGPWLSGALYDRTGSYLAIYGVATMLLLIGLAALVAFTRLTRRRPEGPPR